MDVTATATRSGDWWAVEVAEIPGLFTQAKRLEQIPELVADAAALLGHPDVTVTVVPTLPGRWGRSCVEVAPSCPASDQQ